MCIDGTAVIAHQRELPFVGQRAIGLHVISHQTTGARARRQRAGRRRGGQTAGDIQGLFIAAQDDAVSTGQRTLMRDQALGIGVIDAAHGEVHAAFAIGGEVIEQTAGAV